MALVSLAEYADLHAEQNDTLNHTCTVTRLTAGTADADGQPTYTSSTHLTNLPCAYIAPSGGNGEVVNADITALVTNPELIVPYGTDVRASDTITQVKDQWGTVIGGPYNITRVDKRAMHFALQLEEIA